VPDITFQPWGLVVRLQDGETVFAAAQRIGVPVPTACGGKGNCGLCRVKILAGEEGLPPLVPEEKKHLGNSYFISKLRLSCRLRPTAPLVVLLPDAARGPKTSGRR
jgi:ferredoxin